METKSKNFLKCFWQWLSKPSAKYSILAIGGVSFVVGILFWGGFHTALEATNSTEFCIGCHEMADNVYPDYKENIHYMNRSGVRAGCPDCHVPHEWGPKVYRKIQASGELYHMLMGDINTREKFEAARMKMATHEWERMKSTNSRECRNCHNFDAMSPELQKQTPYKKHMKAKEEGKTCIDCHKGIAHHLPAEYEEPDD